MLFAVNRFFEKNGDIMFLYGKEIYTKIEELVTKGVDPNRIVGILMDAFELSPEEAKTCIWEFARDRLHGEAQENNEGSN